MEAITESLPGLGAALVPGPVFFRMTVTGDPVARKQPAPRIIYPKGGKPFVSFYTVTEQRQYMEMLSQYARLQMRSRPPSERALTFLVIADVRVPESWSLRDKAAALEGRILPTSKPDDDNFRKMASDALSKIVFRDDAQIVDGRQLKRYSASPALTIEVREFVSP